MDEASPVCAQHKPRWFTPGRLLVIFCTINLVVYLDRGVIASNGVNGSPRTADLPEGSGIQGEFGLSNLQDGFLATAFLVGLLLASPVFSESCKHHSAFRLIGVGMGAWTVAVLGCGAAPSYTVLILCRMLVGVGEASFVALAAPFIDDYAPPRQKARWFALFYLCIPVGFAAGYIFGGIVGVALGWRAAFLLEGVAMAPFVAFAFASAPLHLSGSRDDDVDGPDPGAPKSLAGVARELARDARAVAAHAVWRNMVGAYVLYTAVLGVYAFWGPKAGKRIYQLQGETADLVFGGVTVATGVVGSLLGGAALDWLGATIANASALCGAAQLVGLSLLLPAFLATRSFSAFVALFAAGELALFSLQAPVAAIGMWAVPAPLRPLAISLTTVAIHLLGDVPSPPLVGALQSALEAGKTGREADDCWRVSMAATSCLLAGAGGVFLWGARVAAAGAPDYRRPEELAAVHQVAAAHRHLGGGQGPAPLADGGDGVGGGGAAAAADAAEAGTAPAAAGDSGRTSPAAAGAARPERQPLLQRSQRGSSSSSSTGGGAG